MSLVVEVHTNLAIASKQWCVSATMNQHIQIILLTIQTISTMTRLDTMIVFFTGALEASKRLQPDAMAWANAYTATKNYYLNQPIFKDSLVEFENWYKELTS